MKVTLGSLTRSLTGLALLWLATVGASPAHVFTGVDGSPLRWPGDQVTWSLSLGTDDSLANVTAGSDPAAALEAAFEAWAEPSGLTAIRAVDSVVTNSINGDGVNLVSFADTAANRARFGGSNTLAITIYRFNTSRGELTDVDMLFNPDLTWSSVGQVGGGKQFPIEAIATHEAGHFIGVAHSAIGTATLFPFGSEIGDVNGSTDSPASLSSDDLGAANVLYPDPTFAASHGGIHGQVTRSGLGVFGAHVTATSVDTGLPTAGFLTLGQGQDLGQFAIQGLPPGDYLLHVEPADGPTTAANWGADPFDTGYRTTFLGGNAVPEVVTVVAGPATDVGAVAVEAIGPLMNPRSIVPVEGLGEGLSAIPVRLVPGESRELLVSGSGFVGIIPDVSCSDPDVVLGSITSPAAGLLSIPVTLAVDAPEGGRNLLFEDAGELAIFTGAFDVDCLGDPNCYDTCPDDENKTEPGECGCGVPETGDSDLDGVHDCNDACPADPLKAEAGDCGCGQLDTDSDNDGTANCNDGCPFDPLKTEEGECGCFIRDTDMDGDGTPDCNDDCPADAAKTTPGDCGCGEDETDSDLDGTADCIDECPVDGDKSEPGECGCGIAEPLPGGACECVQGDLHGADDVVDLRDWLVGWRKLRGGEGGVTEQDHRCGDLVPGRAQCEGTAAERWCPAGDGQFDEADLEPLRQAAAGLLELGCGDCPSSELLPSDLRRPGDVVGSEGLGGDGIVNVIDVVKILRWAVGIDEHELLLDDGEWLLRSDLSPSSADGPLTVVGGDGEVNVLDVVLALQTAVGSVELAWPERGPRAELGRGLEAWRPSKRA